MRLVLAFSVALLFASAPALGCPYSEKEGTMASKGAASSKVEVADQTRPVKSEGATPDRSEVSPAPPKNDSSRRDG